MRTFFPLSGRGRLRRGRGWLLGTAVVALAASGIALAGPGPASLSLAQLTFYTDTMTKSHTDSCTSADSHPIDVLDATFTGMATFVSVPGFTTTAVPVTVHVKSVLDTTANIGSLKGDIRIESTPATPAGHFHARLTAVNNGGVVQGFVDGNLGGGMHLIGNLTGTFSSATGFSSSGSQATIGGLGGGTDTALLTSGGCKQADQPKPDHPEVDHPKPDHPKPPKHDKHHH